MIVNFIEGTQRPYQYGVQSSMIDAWNNVIISKLNRDGISATLVDDEAHIYLIEDIEE